MRQLEIGGILDVYLSVGFRYEQVIETMGEQFGAMRLHYVVENEPLGTGGAVYEGVKAMPADAALIFNGDTFAVLDLPAFVADAQTRSADISIAVAQVADVGRYGAVDVHADGQVHAFLEKGGQGPGWINAGVYYLRKSAMLNTSTLPERFSFEQDFLVPRLNTLCVTAFPGVRDFIDIGVPDDYRAAQRKVPMLLAGM
jgi:D-glycero-alpha-D-manno-heptose 1-phosphate guanylyltransferase